ESQSELVFEQLTYSANAAIAKMVNVVVVIEDRAAVTSRLFSGDTFELQREVNHVEEIRRRDERVVEPVAFGAAHLDVEFQPTHAREIEFARVEDHPVEKRLRSFERRRIAGPHLAINFDQGFLLRFNRILSDSLGDDGTDIILFGEKDLQCFDPSH